jgi:CheY-like chemotaxis protein
LPKVSVCSTRQRWVSVCNFEQFLNAKILTLGGMPSHVRLTPQRKIVLCVDDNEDMLECEKAFLESFGYTVLTAPSGGEALELASIHSVDVVIVDYVMPEMNGHEVAVEMRRLRPQAPIIMLSGAVDVPEQALKSVDAFIVKDQLANQLLTAIVQLQEC